MTPLVVNADEIRTFTKAVFPHASEGLFVSLRTLADGGEPGGAIDICPVKLNGPGLEPLITAAIKQAQAAADDPRKAVFCPPLAGFSNPGKAGEKSLAEGYTIAVECDERPAEARQKLEFLLGTATVVVASGGRWEDNATGEAQDKLHLHWRLKEPATGEDLARLKEARRLAAELVGADMSNVAIVHPIRWPGSWHRKGEPRLARIISVTENELELGEALELLRMARQGTSETPARSGRSAQRQGQRPVRL